MLPPPPPLVPNKFANLELETGLDLAVKAGAVGIDFDVACVTGMEETVEVVGMMCLPPTSGVGGISTSRRPLIPT